MKVQIKKPLKALTEQGDTIVEVLIALAIAAFAIGISYATAQRSLQQAIAAREHNEALNIMENQLTDLQFRFQRSSAAYFDQNFAQPPPGNYCLDDNSKSSNDKPPLQWTPIFNNSSASSGTLSSLNVKTSGGAYDPRCHEAPNGAAGTNYFYNITTKNYGQSTNSTLYTVTVRWARLGGGINKASLFYKLNNNP